MSLSLVHKRISVHDDQRDMVKLTYSERLVMLLDNVLVLLEPSYPPCLVRGDALYP